MKIPHGSILVNFNKELIPGKQYIEDLSVKNIGETGVYSKITIFKYYEDENGKRVEDINTNFINLNLVKDGWEIDKSSSDSERTVMYSTKVIDVHEDMQFLETISIAPNLLYNVKHTSEQKENNTTIISTEKISKGKKYV